MPISAAGALVVRSVTARYGNREVLSDVNLEVKCGECVALLGPNGSGKSTVLRVLAGQHKPTRGETQLIMEHRELSPSDVAVWLVPQGAPMFWPLTIHENLASATYGLTKDVAQNAITRVMEWVPEVRPLLGRRAISLSGGERQLCSIAIGLLRNPRFLLLDEPSAGLAPGALPVVIRVIRDQLARGAGVVVVEHRQPELIELASRAYVLGEGRVVYEGPVGSAPRELTSGM